MAWPWNTSAETIGGEWKQKWLPFSFDCTTNHGDYDCCCGIFLLNGNRHKVCCDGCWWGCCLRFEKTEDGTRNSAVDIGLPNVICIFIMKFVSILQKDPLTTKLNVFPNHFCLLSCDSFRIDTFHSITTSIMFLNFNVLDLNLFRFYLYIYCTGIETNGLCIVFIVHIIRIFCAAFSA